MRVNYANIKRKEQNYFSRTFNAPANKVFDTYTQKELFEQWFYPEGASVEVYQFNAVEGGKAFSQLKHRI